MAVKRRFRVLFFLWGVFFTVVTTSVFLNIASEDNAGLEKPLPVQASASVPVLLVYNDTYTSNPFGLFLGEILKAEGYNLFNIEKLSNLSLSILSGYDSVILAETTLTSSQSTIFSQYVQSGGNLLALRPDHQLDSVFGLGSSAGTMNNAYVAIQPTTAYGNGFTASSLQTHATANLYNGVTAQIVALLYSNATNATTYPAVTINSYGSGKAVAFTYDLAKSVIYLRQGNPNQINVDADGDGVIRVTDMYYNWINLDKMPLPQADIQQRLFARLLSQLTQAKKPLPRFWYFPDAKKTVMVLTNDTHAEPDSYYSNVVALLSNYGATSTFFMSVAGQPTPENVTAWRSQGFSFSTHPYKINTTLTAGYNDVDTWLAFRYGPRTNRTTRIHQVAWEGWVDAGKVGVSHNYAMDFTYYHYGSWFKKPNNSWAQGFVTGSGLPMKLIDQNGQIVNNFGQYTRLVDEQWHVVEQTTTANAIQYSRQAIDSSEAGDYQSLVMQIHLSIFNDTSSWVAGTLTYAQSLNIPMIDAEKWLHFTEKRYNSTFSNLSWSNNQLEFTANIPAGQSGQTVTLPINLQNGNLREVTLNGFAQSYTTSLINGEDMAFITLPAGVSVIRANYNLSQDCDPLLVNTVADTVSSTNCETSLRKALNNAAATGGTVRLNRTRLTSNPVEITLTSPLVIPQNVTLTGIDGSCSAVTTPGLRLLASFANALQLSGGNTIIGTEIRTTTGPALKTLVPGNNLQCILTTILPRN